MPVTCFWLIIVALIANCVLPVTARAAEDAMIAPTASMNEQVLTIPGDPGSPAMLQVTILRPDGPGPFPLAVMNHGAGGARPDQEPRYRFSFSSYYFLSRGYAVVLPMMRGFAGSTGKQNLNGCNQEAVGLANAKDIAAVIDFMATQPMIDINRAVLAGQSFGGWNTLAFGALNHSKIRGLINFSGGAVISNCRATEAALASAAGHFGALSRVPSIWFFGDNDSKFAPSVWHAMYERYVAAGGAAELVAYGPFMADSHNLLGFPEGLKIWAPRVDAFLGKLRLPAAIIHPEFLPAEFPGPSNYAAIDDVAAVPYVEEGGRNTYRKFLSDAMPKVFVISPAGMAASFTGGFDPLGRAMTACENARQKCQVYAVDDHVTWTRSTPAPRPTNFAPIDDASAIPYINEGGRGGYLKYLAMRKPKAFAIAPDGAWSASSLGADPIAASMSACSKSHSRCQLYAVDDNVVWSSN
jgi:dienelactone hydrolase